jgi:hypothetical protein
VLTLDKIVVSVTEPLDIYAGKYHKLYVTVFMREDLRYGALESVVYVIINKVMTSHRQYLFPFFAKQLKFDSSCHLSFLANTTDSISFKPVFFNLLGFSSLDKLARVLYHDVMTERKKKERDRLQHLTEPGPLIALGLGNISFQYCQKSLIRNRILLLI